MSDWGVVDEPQDREDLERLNDAWNGEAHGPLDNDDQRVLDRLAMLAGEIKPPPAFVSRLREQLMSTTVLPASASLSAEKILELPTPRATLTPKRAQRWSWSGLASAAVILTILGGLFAVVLNNRGGGDPPKATEFSALAPNAAAGSPEASPGATDYEFPAYYVAHASVDNTIGAPWGAVEGLSAATLYNVRVDPGETMVREADSDASVTGVVVDFVADGAYTAIFEDGAIIFRTRAIQGSPVHYVQPGETAEVQKGDGVTYSYGSKTTITNPLTMTPLRFESVILTTTSNPLSPVVEGGAFNLEATAALPPTTEDSSGWYFEMQQVYPRVLNPEREPAIQGNGIALFDDIVTYFQNFEYRIIVSTGNRG